VSGFQGTSRSICQGAKAGDQTQAAGSSSEESSLSGLFTRVETGHIAMSSAGNGASRSDGSGSTPSQCSILRDFSFAARNRGIGNDVFRLVALF
jgi:hypothetical protein